MAQTTPESKLLSDSTGQEVKEQVLESERGEVGAAGTKHVDDSSSSIPSVAVPDPHSEKSSSHNSTNAQSNAPSSRPSLVPLGSANVQTSVITPIAPHPKRFSAVNINKKFLEKNTASGSAASSSSSSTAKSGNPATRPPVQPTSSHSRLVTAKLTASPAVATSTAGWSRPSSVAPSPATNSPNSTSPMPTAPVSQPSATAAPQLPHVGKVILPQLRNALPQISSQKDNGGNKPVWGNVKPSSARPELEPNDFPTAAEVANVASTLRKQTKAAEEAKTTSDTAAKLLRSEEADAFRGVHLDPNVHHWDEMEEDDDNFLGGVIEFGDGRQYKIESNEPNEPGTLPAGSVPRYQADEPNLKESALPVSKEERFVDDFDRSWPKSRTSPASAPRDVPPTATPQIVSPSISPVISNVAHSPQDSSRVLFNERSNRLEPYSQTHRQQPGSFGPKRPQYQEGSGPMQERNVRDGAPSIQVLQKPGGGDFNSRGRRFSGSSTSYAPGPPNGVISDRNRDREQLPRRDAPPPSPRLSREHHTPLGIDTGNRDFNNERGRKSNMGPPPVPLHAGQKHLQDGGRQLPPHLSQVSPNIPSQRLPSRDSRFSPAESSAGLPTSTSVRIPPHSPAISHASLNIVSPVAPPNTTLPLSAPEMDEVRKDVMHTAAERAKQRRQQEEEEREALKERARRKAQEIEEKMKAEKEKQQQKEAEEASLVAAKHKEAISVIEDAVKTVDVSLKTGTTNPLEPLPRRLSLQRPPSLKAIPRASDSSRPTRRLSTTAPWPIPVPASPAVQTESWRARANPVPTSPLPRQIQSRPSISANFIPSGPSAAEQVESIADGSKDDLEVVDFSDMGKFVGIPDVPEAVSESPKEMSSSAATLSRLSRPIASDFFDEPTATEASIPPSKKADFGAWRRKVSQEVNDPPAPKPADGKTQSDEETKKVDTPLSAYGRVTPIKDQASIRDESPDASAFSTKEPLSYHDGQTVHGSQNPNVQRTPRSQTFYKEATMSALDDAMSRIKGVLVTMQTHESPKEVSPSSSSDNDLQPSHPVSSTHPLPIATVRTNIRDRWVPPPLRPRRFDDNDEPQEIFLATVLQPPVSPPPAGNKIVLRLPSVSHPVDLINKKQLHAFFRPPFQARMDILSFDPPVPDMNRRDLSLNDVLFRKSNFMKGKFTYRVALPRHKGPRVNIPSATQTKLNGVGAFGRPTVADGAATWRKPATPSMAKVDFEAELNTTSRSPPPDSTPPETHVTSIPKSSENSPTKSDSYAAVRSRAQPKMPAGSAVAFRRDSRIIEADATPLVNFIVGSQLDGASGSQIPPSPSPAQSSLDEKGQLPMPSTNGIVKSISSDGERAATFAPNNAEKTDSSNDHVLVTPPTHHSAASWSRSSVSLPVKESPARAPDPEHLKAVWSQTSNKAGLHAVNSLEGIADDLTALPFTLQDVKSEDGETPPPSLPSAPSRMSLHDVTRAFQTVPTSSTASTQPQHRAPFSPPSTHAPVARPSTGTYAYSPVQNNMRPAYVPYPSPMMSHSPAPVMYGHPMTSSPVPSRMQLNGHTPLYSQPMWMTMPTPSSQPHGNIMRPVVSPYPAQMMAYASPGYGPQPPPPNMMPATPQAQSAGRGRGMPVMSPVMSHTHAHPVSTMYGSSPVMIHAVQVPQNHGYMSIPAGRGQPRTDNGQMPAPPPPPQPQHTTHNGHHQPSHNGFNPAPAQSFVRPSW